MSDTHDHEKTTFVRVPGARPGAPDPQAEPDAQAGRDAALDHTVILKASPRAREAAAALTAEREAKRMQTPEPPMPAPAPSLDSVDFDVTAGFSDEAPAEAVEFIDITQGAGAEATPSPPPAPATTGGTGRRVLIAVIVAAVIAAGLWFVTR